MEKVNPGYVVECSSCLKQIRMDLPLINRICPVCQVGRLCVVVELAGSVTIAAGVKL